MNMREGTSGGISLVELIVIAAILLMLAPYILLVIYHNQIRDWTETVASHHGMKAHELRFLMVCAAALFNLVMAGIGELLRRRDKKIRQRILAALPLE